MVTEFDGGKIIWNVSTRATTECRVFEWHQG